MPTVFNTSIVIPCYNEEKGISHNEYSHFLNNNPEAFICFVNDGSKDNTLGVLNALKEELNNHGKYGYYAITAKCVLCKWKTKNKI